MSNFGFTESVVEDAALAWFEALGYSVLHGPAIAAGEPGPNAATRTTATWCWKAACARRSRASTRVCHPKLWTTPTASSRALMRRRCWSVTTPCVSFKIGNCSGEVVSMGRRVE